MQLLRQYEFNRVSQRVPGMMMFRELQRNVVPRVSRRGPGAYGLVCQLLRTRPQTQG